MKLHQYSLNKIISLLFIATAAVHQLSVFGEDSVQNIIVKDAWVRQTPPVSRNSAAYFILSNTGNMDVTIVHVEASIAEKANMHDFVIKKNMGRMLHLPQLTIPAGEQVVFAPGGKHLMLVNLTEKLELNKDVSVIFTLVDGQKIVSKMPILKAKRDAQKQHHH